MDGGKRPTPTALFYARPEPEPAEDNPKYLSPDNIGTKISIAFSSGCVATKRNVFKIHVKTRDCEGAGTCSRVFCAIIGKNGERTSNLLLHNRCTSDKDMARGNEAVFKFSYVEHIHEISSLELWRVTTGKDDDWFCEYVLVTHSLCNQPDACTANDTTLQFPCHEWIKTSRKYNILLYNYCLPQLETSPERKLQRKEEIIDSKVTYKYEKELTGLPRLIEKLPNSEVFSLHYEWDIARRALHLLAQGTIEHWFESSRWKTFEDMLVLYKGVFTIPKGWYNWNLDQMFGDQRLNGLNTTQLRRCEQIPENLPVTDEMVKAFVDDHTLREVIQQKRLFIADLKILDGVHAKDRLPAPLALFYANPNGDLLPIAIQLFPEPAEDNPIFLPSDADYTWILAKMYFNNADAAIHQSCNHLGFTHMAIESICCACHQSLPTCHPVFQLLAPHFLYLLAINSTGLPKLIGEGGIFDTVMSMGSVGFKEILKRGWKSWRFDVEGWYPTQIESRGVDDKEILPSYYRRDDSLLLHTCIVDYVTEVLSDVYDTRDKLIEDYEVQEFASILVDKEDGAGIQGVFGGGKFEKLEDLIKVVSATIFISSVSHAAVNFGQYNEYAFPPCYPGKLQGQIPKDKKPRTEQDALSHLPDKDITLDMMFISNLLSQRNTDSLGYFDIQYLYEPKAVEAVIRFQEHLSEIGEKIDERNKNLQDPYQYLRPELIPNAISI